MKLLPRLTLIAVVGLMTSGASCTNHTVRLSPPHRPAPCLDECKPYLDALPQANDSIGRKVWELNVIWDYKACNDLHNECRRMLEDHGRERDK